MKSTGVFFSRRRLALHRVNPFSGLQNHQQFQPAAISPLWIVSITGCPKSAAAEKFGGIESVYRRESFQIRGNQPSPTRSYRGGGNIGNSEGQYPLAVGVGRAGRTASVIWCLVDSINEWGIFPDSSWVERHLIPFYQREIVGWKQLCKHEKMMIIISWDWLLPGFLVSVQLQYA